GGGRRGGGLAPARAQGAARLGGALEPVVRRAIDERTVPDVDAGRRLAEYGETDARLGLGRLSLPLEDARAALHPVGLPRPVKGAAPPAGDPSVVGHEGPARAVRPRAPR